MAQPILITEISSFQAKAGEGAATGNIWLEFDGKHFPAQHWNDFVVVLLGWWTNALLRLLRDSSIKETVSFMEGPYAVEVTRISSEKLRFRALSGIHRNNIVMTGESSIASFALALIAQSRQVLDVCREHA